MRLVTVTCKEDVIPFLLQAESISKFVAPCDHLVIIEDDDFDKKYWYNILSPYYSNHNLILKSYNQYKIKNVGWERQQCYKLLAALECDGKYLILDSKDFFIRKTSLCEWCDYYGSNAIIELSFVKNYKFPTTYHQFPNMKISEAYAEYFNKEILYECYATRTPFVIDTSFINKNTLLDDVNWFANNPYKCEFLFYNYMAQDNFFNFKKNNMYALKIRDCNDILLNNLSSLLNNLILDKNCMVVGFGRLIKNCSNVDFNEINEWLKLIGLNNKIW